MLLIFAIGSLGSLILVTTNPTPIMTTTKSASNLTTMSSKTTTTKTASNPPKLSTRNVSIFAKITPKIASVPPAITSKGAKNSSGATMKSTITTKKHASNLPKPTMNKSSPNTPSTVEKTASKPSNATPKTASIPSVTTEKKLRILPRTTPKSQTNMTSIAIKNESISEESTTKSASFLTTSTIKGTSSLPIPTKKNVSKSLNHTTKTMLGLTRTTPKIVTDPPVRTMKSASNLLNPNTEDMTPLVTSTTNETSTSSNLTTEGIPTTTKNLSNVISSNINNTKGAPPLSVTTTTTASNLSETTMSTLKHRKACQFGDKLMPDSAFWTHSNFFNVTCLDGRIKVLNCVTDKGTQLALGTKSHIEAGVRYACQLNFRHEQAHKQNKTSSEPVLECEGQLDRRLSRGEYIRDGFVVSCWQDIVLGCLDHHGDLVKSGHHYLIGNHRQLRLCGVYGQGRWAKSDLKGCFNGTLKDDPDDVQFHVQVGRIWQIGAFEVRCGEDGIQVYKCLVDGRRIHTGTAWFDRENVLNVCK